MSDRSLIVLGPGSRLAPARGVRLAADLGEVVVLDVFRDEYSALGPGVSAAVRWALNPADVPEPPNAVALVEPLVKNGLLGLAPVGTAGITLPEPAEPGGVASYRWTPHLSWAARSGVRASTGQTARALAAIIRADRALRRGRLAGVLAWLRGRRAACRTGATGPGSAVVAAELVDAHIRARMLYPREIQCLAGSAALTAHAWTAGIPVRFVIGVQKYPFVAHAWVEFDSQVLNDRHDVARRLAPIVSIPVAHDHS
jgi:hypothetical protein